MAGSPQIVLSDAPNREDNKWKENRVAKILLEIESPIQGRLRISAEKIG